MGEDKKGKGKKFFLWAAILAVGAAIVAIFRRRRNQALEESEWQELPPAEGS
ncbi:MAG TPA: hypothetical protein VEA19_08125 [Actinomycetota bacterium]|nr:hypothetical protein [Actinomycetota bacterium]